MSDEPLPPPPGVEQLLELDADAWAWLLAPVRGVLDELAESDARADLAHLREAATSRLAGGPLRRELCELISRDGPVWHRLVVRVRGREDRPDAVGALLEAVPVAGRTLTGRDDARPSSTPPQRAVRDRERTQRLRDERDALRRRLDAATNQVGRLEQRVAQLEQLLGEHTVERDRLLTAQARAEQEREAAVQRERRRRNAEVEGLEHQLGELRRTLDEERRQRRREEERAARMPPRDAVADVRPPAAAPHRPRVVPGRPSRLPDGVHPDTREAAELLLAPGRRLLVDGYNVTKSLHPELDLEGQRRWLVALLGNLAAARQVRPLVLFDGDRPVRGGRRLHASGVEVRFTSAGITADDELVFEVEATDEPVVVVTDDAELRARVAASGGDLLRTAPLRWIAP